MPRKSSGLRRLKLVFQITQSIDSHVKLSTAETVIRERGDLSRSRGMPWDVTNRQYITRWECITCANSSHTSVCDLYECAI